MSTISLNEAYLCPDCDIIGEDAISCASCGGNNLLGLARVLNRSTGGPNDWPECKEFYDLMQYYRHFPLLDQVGTIDAYEAVKAWLRLHRERKTVEEKSSETDPK